MSVHSCHRCASLVASLRLLVRFKASLALTLNVFVFDYLGNFPRLSGRYLAVLGDHPLLEVVVVMRE